MRQHDTLQSNTHFDVGIGMTGDDPEGMEILETEAATPQ